MAHNHIRGVDLRDAFARVGERPSRLIAIFRRRVMSAAVIAATATRRLLAPDCSQNVRQADSWTAQLAIPVRISSPGLNLRSDLVPQPIRMHYALSLF